MNTRPNYHLQKFPYLARTPDPLLPFLFSFYLMFPVEQIQPTSQRRQIFASEISSHLTLFLTVSSPPPEILVRQYAGCETWAAAGPGGPHGGETFRKKGHSISLKPADDIFPGGGGSKGPPRSCLKFGGVASLLWALFLFLFLCLARHTVKERE